MPGLLKTAKGPLQFMMSGYVSGSYQEAEGSADFFAGTVAPIVLFKFGDRFLFEAEFEYEYEDGHTNTDFEYAQFSYVINDHMVLGLGKFLNPANPFAERLHAHWINKLPDGPLGLGSKRVQSFAQTGVQLHGALPVGEQRLNYAVYLSNGPSLATGASDFGGLESDNSEDSNGAKSIGARVGYFVIPQLELGYSFEKGQITPTSSASANADAVIQSFDLNYVDDVAGGTLDVRSQWVFSDLDTIVFDPAGTSYGPLTLKNERDSAYLQGAFRLNNRPNDWLGKLEGVLRWDRVNLPTGASEGGDETRWTIGVNYWTAETSVLKLAYQIDSQDAPGADANALLLQWAVGL